jgi:hypothetical protein
MEIEAAGGSWAVALDICEQAARCFPGTLCVGVDLLPLIGRRRFAVAEVNGFGDLLPGLTGLSGRSAEGGYAVPGGYPVDTGRCGSLSRAPTVRSGP